MPRKKTGRQKKKIGRPLKHGGYSLILKDELVKEHPRLREYLQDSRAGLIQDVAGDEAALSEQQRIMIDRIVSRLSICRLIEIYIEKYGAFRRDQIKRHKILELEPALGVNYLAFSNSIDRALVALGLNKKRADSVLDLGRYIAEHDKQTAEAAAKAKAEGRAKAGKQAQDAQADRQGKSGDDGGKAEGTGGIEAQASTSSEIPGDGGSNAGD